MREDYYAGLEDRNFESFSDAKGMKKKIDFSAVPPAPAPHKLGITVIDDVEVSDVLDYMDWNPFFQTWELRGRYPNRSYPKIFNDEAVGSEAKKLFDDAQKMLKEIIAEKTMRVKGVVAIFPANRTEDGEDVNVYETEEDRASGKVKATFHMLRQQAQKESDDPFLSQADFVAPAGHDDYLGMFAVSCFGCDALVKKCVPPSPSALRALNSPTTPAQVRGGQRRLLQDHGAGARRPHRGGVRGVPAREDPQGHLGVQPGGGARHGEHAQDQVPGHPPCAGLPLAAGPHGEVHHVGVLQGSRARRHRALVLAQHDAGRVRVRARVRAPRVRVRARGGTPP
jgi:hypothetical protein